MKRWAILFIPVVACASPVYDGYEAYYSTLPSPLFNSLEKKALQPYSVRPDKDVKLAWTGKVDGLPHRLVLDKGTIRLDQRTFKISAAKAFQDETSDPSDLGIGTDAYFSPGYVCLENTPASASGTAVRHKAVYLIRIDTPQKAFKLPSLFASCQGIRLSDGVPAFNKVTYHYEDGQDQPDGVTFAEFSLRGDSFISTGKLAFAKFVEPENVYRFSLRASQK